MAQGISMRLGRLHRSIRAGLDGPQILIFTPALALGAFWIGGEATLLALAILLPMIGLAAARFRTGGDDAPAPQGQAPVMSLADLTALADRACANAEVDGAATACLMVELDGLDHVAQHAGAAAADGLRDLMLTRLRGLLRGQDAAHRVGDSRFAILLAPAPRLDLETQLQLATRVQSALEEPVALDETMRYFSASIGLAGSSRMPGPVSGKRLVEAAHVALAEAVHRGPSGIRAWNEGIARGHSERRSLVAEVRKALADGQIQPWFQPQVCTSTGAISGVEALARWIHPERGIVPPGEFLRCLEEAGLLDALGTAILQHALTALRTWDGAGIDVPRISVNLSAEELKLPNLVDRVRWELDRFGVPPHRLGFEVLETVVSGSGDSVTTRNVGALSALGCFIDLDDFGTGHASLTALTTLRVNRLKIDRSYVSSVDRDENQRRMIAAVLSLAERLELETLAEGVESAGEHALLAQLGCGHVQGFGIARPMPADKLIGWARIHEARIAEAQRLGRGHG